jgi:UV DNA damage endonuclease
MPAAVSSPAPNGLTNPQLNPEVIDAPNAYRASPDSDVDRRMAPGPVKSESGSESPLSDVPEAEPPAKKKPTKKAAAPKALTPAKKVPVKKEANDEMGDAEAEGDEEVDEEEMSADLGRTPPVHSDYLPLPWKGRLGYVRLTRSKMMKKTATNRYRLASTHISATAHRLSLHPALVALRQS